MYMSVVPVDQKIGSIFCQNGQYRQWTVDSMAMAIAIAIAAPGAEYTGRKMEAPYGLRQASLKSRLCGRQQDARKQDIYRPR